MTRTARAGDVWANWNGSHVVGPVHIVKPRTEAEVAAAVRCAHEKGVGLRAVGAGYSWGDVAVPGSVLVRSDGLAGVRDVDLEAGTARVAAGTCLEDVSRTLWDGGAELPNLGGFSGQTIGGAIATATHGTGVDHPSLSALVQRARIVDSRGVAVDVDGQHEATLRAARVARGLLGVMTEVCVRVRAASWLRVADSWHERFDATWLTRRDGVRRAIRWHVGDRAAPSGMPFHLREWHPAAGGTDGALPSYRALSAAGATRPPSFVVLEYALPAADARSAVDAIEAALARRADIRPVMPIAIRSVAGDDAFLSPYGRGDSVTVSAAGRNAREAGALFSVVHEALLPYKPRPHWGKENLIAPSELSGDYPDLGRFEEIRRSFDPQGMLLTPGAQELLAGIGGTSASWQRM